MSRLVITEVAQALTFDAGWRVLAGVDILVQDGLIQAIGPGLAAAWPEASRLDGRGRIAMPGLVNAHTHSPEALARGIADRMPLDRWLPAIWTRLDALSPAEIRIAVLLGACEMLQGGVTGVIDHFRQTPLRPEAIDAAAAAWEEAGMRAVAALMLRDRPGPAGGPMGAPWAALLPGSEQLAIAEDAARRWPGRIGLAPSAPIRVTDALLAGIGDLGRRHGLILHAHVDETIEEARTARELYGCSAIAHIERLGLVTRALSLAHCVWIEAADPDRLARGGAVVVHNPVSNLRLGAGVMPLAALRRAGVTVAIGTDGAASNDGQSLLEAMKLAILQPRPAEADPARWPSARDALRMAADAGAAAMGRPPPRLEAGAPADLALIDAGLPGLAVPYDRHDQIVLGLSGAVATHVVVDGKLVLRDGRPTGFDLAALQAEAREVAKKLELAAPSRA